ncbi:hypothetical protein H2198_007955 [Neophaeococcomyces mojaviensis]|uniref:Uncharacterized protein n=1 Tax=Neophaeococcomyces mojaviensis TaxID=3383035 RepID=A0ACC2ZYK9_9EURO|nr:hypothetical protein H2198_007955 [Knufia sp. JES_112]
MGVPGNQNDQVTTIKLPPFEVAKELVPGGHELDDVDQQKDTIDLLQGILSTPLLDRLHSVLWLVAKQSGDHVDALHVHALKGRTIKITEDPKLHLIWYFDAVFIKPLPNCLLNHEFWIKHLLPPQSTTAGIFALNDVSPLTRQALGFLRSYGLLIRHASDLRFAQEAHILPADINFAKFNSFIAPFRTLDDDSVAPRYQYGQLRLTRLNWACRLATPFIADQQFLWDYQKQFWQTQQFLDRFGPPLLTVFATVSLVLSAMQVALGAWGDDTPKAFSGASWIFSVAWIVATAFLFALLVLRIVVHLFLQLKFAFRMKREKVGAKHTVARP